MIGQTLAHYRITAAIGAGGMGQVYRATDTKLGRDVALKVLPADMASSPERLERFRREARALAALNHPHIVTIHSVEEADGVHFLTMELVEGPSLDRVIAEGRLPVARILEIAAALVEALAAAHEKGVVHRDLKPKNVMVTTDGRIKVLDYGLALVSAILRDPAPTVDSVRPELPEELSRADTPYTRQLLALVDALSGKKEAALERLASLDVTPLDGHNKFHIAESFGVAGESDRALDILELAVEQGFYPYPYIAEHCPFLAPLRSLPRFAEIGSKALERTDAFRRAIASGPGA